MGIMRAGKGWHLTPEGERGFETIVLTRLQREGDAKKERGCRGGGRGAVWQVSVKQLKLRKSVADIVRCHVTRGQKKWQSGMLASQPDEHHKQKQGNGSCPMPDTNEIARAHSPKTFAGRGGFPSQTQLNALWGTPGAEGLLDEVAKGELEGSADTASRGSEGCNASTTCSLTLQWWPT